MKNNASHTHLGEEEGNAGTRGGSQLWNFIRMPPTPSAPRIEDKDRSPKTAHFRTIIGAPQSVYSTFRKPALGLTAQGGQHIVARNLCYVLVSQGAPEPASAFASHPGPRPARPRSSHGTRRCPEPERGPLHPKGRLLGKATPPSERPSLQLRPRSAATSPGHTPLGGHHRLGSSGRKSLRVPREPRRPASALFPSAFRADPALDPLTELLRGGKDGGRGGSSVRAGAAGRPTRTRGKQQP